jgi:hypothetical protein
MHKLINLSNWRTCSWAYSFCWHPAARWMTAKGTCATAICSIRKSGVIVRGEGGGGGGLYWPGPGPGSLWRRVCLLLPKVTGTTVLMVAMAWGPMVVKSPTGA